MGKFKYKDMLLSAVTVLALVSSVYLHYSKDKSEERYNLLQEQANKTFQRQLGQVSECFGVQIDDSAYTKCIAAVAAADSIPQLTTYEQGQGETIDFLLNKLYIEMLVPDNKSIIINHQDQLFSLFGRLAQNPADSQLKQQLEEFIEGLKIS
ncbi:hypothetical protein [Paenibacillus glycanilyticus]|uniref:hypothetical protein n=1 Tax=Paenibacillus glycanilyticus TaxID=126569 RepID=UPI00191043C8|nr:hypothetical protein [Paenibacillus glycanilyticus]